MTPAPLDVITIGRSSVDHRWDVAMPEISERPGMGAVPAQYETAGQKQHIAD
jgi:hypothetical protein